MAPALEIIDLVVDNDVVGTIVALDPLWLPSHAVGAADLPARRRAARSTPAPELPTRVHVGDVATFSGSHRVSGVATIVSKAMIRVTDLRHDGSAPGLDFRIGLGSRSRLAFTVLRVTGRQAFNGDTLELPLPEGIDLNSFDTFTVWCYEFNVVIAEAAFRAP